MTYACILGGAIIGAPLRYFLQGRVQELSGSTWPWGTLVVNISGCLAIGLLATLAEERDMLGREARLFLLVGFLGSYTTFSTYGWETNALMRDNDIVRAAAYVVASTFVGLLAVWAGSALARVA